LCNIFDLLFIISVVQQSQNFAQVGALSLTFSHLILILQGHCDLCRLVLRACLQERSKGRETRDSPRGGSLHTPKKLREDGKEKVEGCAVRVQGAKGFHKLFQEPINRGTSLPKRCSSLSIRQELMQIFVPTTNHCDCLRSDSVARHVVCVKSETLLVARRR